MKKQLQSWSFSSLTDYEKCPYSQYLKRIARVPRDDPPPDSPLVRGINVHNDAEAYVNGSLPDLPKTLKKFEQEFKDLRALYAEGQLLIEQGWGFDHDWNPCGYDDWGTVWHQSKADAVIVTDETTYTIIDYKTGKSWGNEVKHTQQGQLYAVALMCLFPKAESISVEFWYLDEGKTKKRHYTRTKLAPALASFTKRGIAMTSALDFTPKPNAMNCKWCDYGIFKGNGKCPHAVDPTL